MLKNLIKEFSGVFLDKRISTVVGAWVFYFLTSIIPLVFLFLTILGVFGVELTEDAVSRLPLEFRSAGEAIVSTARRASKGATLLFIITAIFSCSRLLSQMSKDGDYIYGEKSAVKRGVMRRIWAVVALGSLFVIFLLAIILIAVGGNFFGYAFAFGKIKNLIATIAFFLVIILFSFLIIITLNKFICPVKLKFKQLALGSICSLFVIVLGTIFFALYLRFFNSYNAFYGSLASIIVFLLWANILMFGLALGAVINSQLNKTALQLSR